MRCKAAIPPVNCIPEPVEPDDLDEEEKEDRDSKMSIDIVGSDEDDD